MIVLDEDLGRISTKLEMYEALILYARKKTADESSRDCIPEELWQSALNAAAQVEEYFPVEVKELRGDNGGREHGFDLVVLAALHFVLSTAAEPREAEKSFPELDT